MHRFEYKILDFNSLGRRQTLIDALNAEGAAGWELISLSNLNVGIFKRALWDAHAATAQSQEMRGAVAGTDTSASEAALDDREKLRREMEAIARAQGLSLGDILDSDLLSASSPSPIKFQDPERPENTWSGRGRMPKWLARAIAEGTPKEAYRVRSPTED